ncbi:MAG TPA: NUDIX domain-containing protein [Candidatus Limnocylindrales bacterium]|nr:NUDIX domain-containing protein [Candidatus Limnocylindrales bacterium]
MKSRVIVAAVIEKDGKILLGRKKPGVGPYPDTWHLPGGGVNLGEETIDEAILREVKEETGLEVYKLERIVFDEDFEPDKHGEKTHYVFLVYNMRAKSLEVIAGDDLIELKWFFKSDLNSLPLPRPLIKQIKEGLL